MQIIDTLQISEDLKKAGCDSKLAKQIAQQINYATQEVIHKQTELIKEHKAESATKDDIELTKLSLQKDIDETKLSLQKDIDETKLTLQKEIEETKLTLRKEIEETKLTFQKEIEQVKTELLKWMISLFTGQTAIIIGAFFAIVKIGFRN